MAPFPQDEYILNLQEEDNLPTKDNMAGHKASFIRRLHCNMIATGSTYVNISTEMLSVPKAGIERIRIAQRVHYAFESVAWRKSDYTNSMYLILWIESHLSVWSRSF